MFSILLNLLNLPSSISIYYDFNNLLSPTSTILNDIDKVISYERLEL